MIGMWTMFIITDQVPELKDAPMKIYYHLTAEFLTAILLLISGFTLIKNHSLSIQIYLISLGMLLYTVIVSAGYYANTGEAPMVLMFTVFQVLTALFIVVSLYKYKELKK